MTPWSIAIKNIIDIPDELRIKPRPVCIVCKKPKTLDDFAYDKKAKAYKKTCKDCRYKYRPKGADYI